MHSINKFKKQIKQKILCIIYNFTSQDFFFSDFLLSLCVFVRARVCVYVRLCVLACACVYVRVCLYLVRYTFVFVCFCFYLVRSTFVLRFALLSLTEIHKMI